MRQRLVWFLVILGLVAAPVAATVNPAGGLPGTDEGACLGTWKELGPDVQQYMDLCFVAYQTADPAAPAGPAQGHVYYRITTCRAEQPCVDEAYGHTDLSGIRYEMDDHLDQTSLEGVVGDCHVRGTWKAVGGPSLYTGTQLDTGPHHYGVGVQERVTRASKGTATICGRTFTVAGGRDGWADQWRSVATGVGLSNN